MSVSGCVLFRSLSGPGPASTVRKIQGLGSSITDLGRRLWYDLGAWASRRTEYQMQKTIEHEMKPGCLQGLVG